MTAWPASVLHIRWSTSKSNAWAVGSPGTTGGLILHWNGAKWKLQPAPNAGVHDELNDVDATGRFNAWAVGSSMNLDQAVEFALATRLPSSPDQSSHIRRTLRFFLG